MRRTTDSPPASLVAPQTILVPLLLLVALVAAGSRAAEPVTWEGRLEMGDASILLEIEVDAPGEARAWLTGVGGRRRPTAIEAFELEPDRVLFRLPEIERGYAFSGRLTSPTRIEGGLERLPPEVPATDLYLVPVEAEPGVGPWRIGTPNNLTDREGYDNQPHFLPGGRSLLYTSMRQGQTDIYRYDLDSGAIRQVTDTAESEYSPTPLPDGSGFSTVRVESDGTQRLWAFDLDGSKPRLLLSEIEPVGYHAWIDDDTVALFVLGEPPTLQIADLGTGRSRLAAENPGRALQTLGRGDVLFVHKETADSWTFASAEAERDPLELQKWPLESLPGREDFAVLPERRELLMADGSKLFASHLPGDPRRSVRPGWREIADFSAHGLGGITRLALAPDRSHLVLVAERPDLSSFPQRIPLTLVLSEPADG